VVGFFCLFFEPLGRPRPRAFGVDSGSLQFWKCLRCTSKPKPLTTRATITVTWAISKAAAKSSKFRKFLARTSPSIKLSLTGALEGAILLITSQHKREIFKLKVFCIEYWLRTALYPWMCKCDLLDFSVLDSDSKLEEDN